MVLEAPISREEFNRQAALAYTEETRRIIESDRERMLMDARQERDERDLSALAGFVEAARSYEERLESFTRRLEKLDAATIQALMQNEIALRQAQQDVDNLLAQAHVLPDGRRVFATEDGTQVFDEHGEQIDPGIITADSISDATPSWEAFRERDAVLDARHEERQQLHDFQRKIDETQERIAEGEISPEELGALEAMFESETPTGVRQALGEAQDRVVPESSALPPQEKDWRFSSPAP